MWNYSLCLENSLTFDRQTYLSHVGKKRPVLCTLTLVERPAISTGVARLIKGWNFLRDEPRRGPKLKPKSSERSSLNDTIHTFVLRKTGIYLVDSVNAQGERFFVYFNLDHEDCTPLERQDCVAHFFLHEGVEELDLMLADNAWTKAWALAQCAPQEQRSIYEQRCFDHVRQVLKDTQEHPLTGRPKQIEWGMALRQQAMQLLRVTWRALSTHPSLPTQQPRLLYALMTCAYYFKTETRAELFIAADYHIARAHVHELVDRFSALGKHHAASPKSRAAPLSDDELNTLRRLSGSIKP